MRDLALAVMAHTESHYEEGGWDIVVECFDIPEIVEFMKGEERWGKVPATEAEAIAVFQSLADLKDQQRKDAQGYIF